MVPPQFTFCEWCVYPGYDQNTPVHNSELHSTVSFQTRQPLDVCSYDPYAKIFNNTWTFVTIILLKHLQLLYLLLVLHLE